MSESLSATLDPPDDQIWPIWQNWYTYIKEDKEIKFIASIICALSSLIAILVLQYTHKLLKSLEYLLSLISRIKKYISKKLFSRYRIKTFHDRTFDSRAQSPDIFLLTILVVSTTTFHIKTNPSTFLTTCHVTVLPKYPKIN